MPIISNPYIGNMKCNYEGRTSTHDEMEQTGKVKLTLYYDGTRYFLIDGKGAWFPVSRMTRNPVQLLKGKGVLGEPIERADLWFKDHQGYDWHGRVWGKKNVAVCHKQRGRRQSKKDAKVSQG